MKKAMLLILTGLFVTVVTFGGSSGYNTIKKEPVKISYDVQKTLISNYEQPATCQEQVYDQFTLVKNYSDQEAFSTVLSRTPGVQHERICVQPPNTNFIVNMYKADKKLIQGDLTYKPIASLRTDEVLS